MRPSRARSRACSAGSSRSPSPRRSSASTPASRISRRFSAAISPIACSASASWRSSARLLMAVGHFLMAFEALLFFALGCLILGIGAFKPNVSTQVGSLYAPGDTRRLRAYSIYYLGINIGAFLAPLVARHARRRTSAGTTASHRRRRHAGRPRDLPRRTAPPAAATNCATRVAEGPGRAVRRRRAARGRRAHLRVRARVVLLGDLRPAGQHAAAVDRGPYRASDRSRLLERRDPDHLVPGDQPADDLRASRRS